ncbi:hypothetical protein JCM24511_01976 [Saitozyma sp. JCM 24511]|nr:hypothetical protein JCM24511_01976 [Saitozyma sp. JCM 24511]
MSSASTTAAAGPGSGSGPGHMSVAELKALMDDPSLRAGVDFLVVDVRRTDLDEPGAVIIPRAINVPAQTFQQTLPTLVTVLSRIPKIVFHCNSSKGRGTRTAGWYAAELERQGVMSSKAYILTGGIIAWKEAYPDEVVSTATATATATA